MNGQILYNLSQLRWSYAWKSQEYYSNYSNIIILGTRKSEEKNSRRGEAGIFFEANPEFRGLVNPWWWKAILMSNPTTDKGDLRLGWVSFGFWQQQLIFHSLKLPKAMRILPEYHLVSVTQFLRRALNTEKYKRDNSQTSLDMLYCIYILGFWPWQPSYSALSYYNYWLPLGCFCSGVDYCLLSFIDRI